MDAIPTPIPPINLKVMSTVCVEANMHPIAEIINMTADPIRAFFLPSLSDNSPATATPIIQPSNAELTNQPSMATFRLN